MRAKSVVTERIQEIEAALAKTPIGRIMSKAKEEELKHELRQLRIELANIDDRTQEAALAETRQSSFEELRSDREDAAFWFRRFFTTLGIANGAAFAALAAGLLQANDPAALAPAVAPAMDHFIWGALTAGSIPFWLWVQASIRSYMREGEHSAVNRKTGAVVLYSTFWLVAAAFACSVVLFCLGLFVATGAVHGLAEGRKAADAQASAESKVRVHAPPPARE